MGVGDNIQKDQAMKPIPIEAMPVVEVLRRDVERPGYLPMTTRGVTGLRWIGGCCPMGLHPKSTEKAPGEGCTFAGGICHPFAVTYFHGWWDYIITDDAPAAMDAIWLVAG